MLDGTGSRTSPATVWTDLLPGATYTVTETVPDGWESDPLQCTGVEDADEDLAGFQFVAAPGVVVSCELRNAAASATGTVEKSTVGGDGSFEFVLASEGQQSRSVVVTTADGDGSSPLPELEPGRQYSLAETPSEGWAESTPLTCTRTPAGGGPAVTLDPDDFAVQPGDVVDCAAVNERLGTIVIVKAVTGADAEFGFRGTWLDAPAFTITTTDGSGSAAFTGIRAGQYAVDEQPRQGYEGSLLSCIDSDPDGTASSVQELTGTIELDPGETVTCSYLNSAGASWSSTRARAPPARRRPSTSIGSRPPVTEAERSH